MPVAPPAARARYILLALATIALGLVVHTGAGRLSDAIRDPIGDALWAVMMTWWVSAALPRASLMTRMAVAFAICIGVELSLLAHWPALDRLRETTLGRLVLGSDFDPRDLAAYAVGVSIAGLFDWAMPRRR